MRDDTKAAQRQFDAWSRSYDRSLLQRSYFGPAHEALLREAVRLPVGAKLLDLGCGTGRFLARLLDSAADLSAVGLDLCEPMLDRARDRCARFGDRVAFAQGSADDLPFPSGLFRAVTCCHSYHHHPDQRATLAEVARVLAPGGELWLIDGDRDGWWGWFLYQGLIRAAEGPVHHARAAELAGWAAAAGLEVAGGQRLGLLAPYHLFRARKPAASARQAA